MHKKAFEAIKQAIQKDCIMHYYNPKQRTALTVDASYMLHHWCVNTDGNGTAIRTILFDYRKAFDFIDHGILVNKVGNLDIPRSVVNWIIDFISHRTQRVELAKGCFSERGPDGFIALRTVPVILKNGNPEIAVNALLDDASIKTHINTDVAAELVPEGKFQKAPVKLLNGTSGNICEHDR